jgi:Fur family ferric uptake transcriptional regulator
MNRKIDVEALCADKGLRITEQRRVIARVLSEAEDHPDVEALHLRAAAIDPGISDRDRLPHRAPVRGCRHPRAA